MKALSVKQPWAELIASGRKPIETRGTRTHYRGPLAIHASLRDDREAFPMTGVLQPDWSRLPRGRVVAIVNLQDCRPFVPDDEAAACTPWRPNAYAWVLGGVRRVDSVLPVRGQLGIWEIPDAIVQEAPRKADAVQEGERVCTRFPDAAVEAPNDDASKDAGHSHKVGDFYSPCNGDLAFVKKEVRGG